MQIKIEFIGKSRGIFRKTSFGQLNAPADENKKTLNATTDNHKLNNAEKNIRFSEISPQKGHLRIIIRTFKGAVKKYCNEIGLSNFNWQRNYYEHIIRNETDLYNIRNYIELNSLKWELDEYCKL